VALPNLTQAVKTMTETTLAAQADYLIGVAARAPSLHNTQPWRFEVS
jgi:nitroreductase